MRWRNASDNMALRQMFKTLIQQSKNVAKEHCSYHRFIFQNHAFEAEDVFGSYGEENLNRLHQIRRRVDPEAVFQILQPGYFKLGVRPPPIVENSATSLKTGQNEDISVKSEL
jgi:Berberine and berberine like